MVNDKEFIRLEMKKQRKNLTKSEKRKCSEQVYKRLIKLEAYKNAKAVCVYMNSFSEIETSSIICDLRNSGKEVVFPVSDIKTHTLTLCRDCKEFKAGAYGILEPLVKESVEYGYPDVVIVPGLAFDREKNRLGFGAGYYDRFLSESGGVKIGICYDFQILDSIPTADHDVKMDIIVSEKQEIF